MLHHSEHDSEVGADTSWLLGNYYSVRFTSSLKLGIWAGIPKISQKDTGFLRLKR